YRHSKSNLDLATYRAYDPDLGRWLSRDPLMGAEQTEGPNLYGYVSNNPSNLVDPLGLAVRQIPCSDDFIANAKAKCASVGKQLKRIECFFNSITFPLLGAVTWDTCRFQCKEREPPCGGFDPQTTGDHVDDAWHYH